MADEKPPFVGPFIGKFRTNDCDVIDEAGREIACNTQREAQWLCDQLSRAHSPTLTEKERLAVESMRSDIENGEYISHQTGKDVLAIIQRLTSPSGGGQ